MHVLLFSEGVRESECKSLISALNLPRYPFVPPSLLTPNPLTYPPSHPTIRSRDMLVNNPVRCSYSDSAYFNYVIKIPYVLSATHTHTHTNTHTHTYCRQSALIKQASDQRRLCGESLTVYRTKDVQGSYYICQLRLILKKNMKLN